MSDKKKDAVAPDEANADEPITTQDYPMPAPPAPDTDAITTQDYPMPAPPADPDAITTKDYPMPAPPALDLGGK
ncbi:sigma-like protein [Streptomyces europaeiscabiei]|uniref:sigma-like protein n=1 Tax=Streptomyces europaeiscabiei TaxID=146819 RepID=UPI0029B707B2|nr:sigma-like protein [Streptomyces europaeiscabiei]MDX3693260.1 sigma-like protein [Streptomyces europaeiscabiei]